MKLTDLERRVRDHAWPSPSPELRARVLAEPPVVTASIRWSARSGDHAGLWPSAPSGHQWRRAGVMLVITFLVMAGACTGWDLWMDRQLDAEIARFEARYGSLSINTLFVPPVPSADNRAHVVRAAAALTIPMYKVVPGYSEHSPAVWGPRPARVSADHRAFAEANQQALQLASGIRTRQQSNWDLGARDTFGTDLPHEGIRTLSDAIYITALMNIEAGRAAEAADAIVSGLGVAASLRQEPGEIYQLIRNGIASRQTDAVRQLISHTEPSSAALESLALWLAESRTPNAMSLGLLGDAKIANAMLARMETGDVNHAIAATLYPMTWPDWPKPFLGIAARIGRPVVRILRVRFLQHTARVLDEDAGPRPRPVPPPEPEPKRWEVIDRLMVRIVGWPRSLLDSSDDFMSELGAAELAVALRRFKLDHGSYPDDLTALAPTYIAVLPIDPYAGGSFAYARQGAGFTLRARGRVPASAKYLALHWEVGK